MTVYIILYYGQVSTLGFMTEEDAFDWLLESRGVKQVRGYDFEQGYQIKAVNIQEPRKGSK